MFCWRASATTMRHSSRARASTACAWVSSTRRSSRRRAPTTAPTSRRSPPPPRSLEKHGITPLLDFHQDLYNERFQGEGWPDWAVLDDGLPAQPQLGFPGNYLVQPALNRAFDNFWANAQGPGEVGLVDRYAAAWTRVAQAFAREKW